MHVIGFMAETTTAPSETARQLPWATPESSDVNEDALKALETYKKRDPSKVVVRFKAVGNAPIMKQNFYKITASNRFQAVIQFLRKELGWKASDPLFTYINLAFSPAPDDTVSNLFKSFCTDGHLIVNYSTTAAWG
ncbi:putative ubiquitin-like modifier [Roridomyces roridus]|uniref:Ubiquitin-like protein ATG12 n=1 Tax=Roridomyces roridus TaxID=1738132 RepID=A0AAD7BHJ1_9AGAR|nr:putative ubiquitin-like modifier [Roridomyces roridus]